MRNTIVGSTALKPTIKVNGTLEVRGSFYVQEKSSLWIRGFVGLRVGVDALEEATMIPQSSLCQVVTDLAISAPSHCWRK